MLCADSSRLGHNLNSQIKHFMSVRCLILTILTIFLIILPCSYLLAVFLMPSFWVQPRGLALLWDEPSPTMFSQVLPICHPAWLSMGRVRHLCQVPLSWVGLLNFPPPSSAGSLELLPGCCTVLRGSLVAEPHTPPLCLLKPKPCFLGLIMGSHSQI